MEAETLYLFDKEFEDKLNWLKNRLRLRMNGEASVQMQARSKAYTINYGVALSDLKEIAADCDFTAADLDRLWQTKIREAMLLAAMSLPDGEMTLERMSRWLGGVVSQDMAEQVSFFAFGRSRHVSDFVALIVGESRPGLPMVVAMFSAARALQLNRPLMPEAVDLVLDFVKKWQPATLAEARACSSLFRAMLRRKLRPAADLQHALLSARSGDNAFCAMVYDEFESELSMLVN